MRKKFPYKIAHNVQSKIDRTLGKTGSKAPVDIEVAPAVVRWIVRDRAVKAEMFGPEATSVGS